MKNYIKFDIEIENDEFIIEQILKIPFKKKINDLKRKKYKYIGCIVDIESSQTLEKNLKKFKNKILSVSKKEVFIKNSYNVYCDGASLNNGQKSKDKPSFGSYGYIILKKINHDNFRIVESGTDGAPDWSNNYSELTAALNSLKRIEWICKNDKKANVVLNTDSQYVTRGATTWMHDWYSKNWMNTFNKPVANKELWIELYELLNYLKNTLKITVRFKWTRGHSKNPTDFDSKMNNEVDNLATLALNKFRNKKTREYRELQYMYLNVRNDKKLIKINKI